MSESLGRFKSVLPLLLVKNGYFLPLLLDFCTILFNPLNKNRGKLSNSLNNFSVGCKQILVWQGTVPLAAVPLAAYRIDCIGDTDSTGRYELRRSVRKKQKPSTKFGGFDF